MSSEQVSGANGVSMPEQQQGYAEEPQQNNMYGRPQRNNYQRNDYQRNDNQRNDYQRNDNQRSFGGRGRGRGMRRNTLRRSRNFVLDFNRFKNRPEILKRVSENFAFRLEKGDTKELFHWASPPLNDYRVGNTIYVRFENEVDMHQYMITAKFIRGEVEWKYAMPDGVRYEFRLKKLN